MLKKFINVTVISVMTLLSLSACSSNNANVENNSTAKEVTTEFVAESTVEAKSKEELQKEIAEEDSKSLEQVEAKDDQGSLKNYIKYYAKETFDKNFSLSSDKNVYKVIVNYSSDSYQKGFEDWVTRAFYAGVFYNIPDKYTDFSIKLVIKCDDEVVGQSELSSKDCESDALSTATNEDSFALLLSDSGLYEVE